jgi:hypothetical protein
MPLTTSLLDWDNVDVMRLFVQQMQMPQVPLLDPTREHLMPPRSLNLDQRLPKQESLTRPQIMQQFVQHMQSLQDNKNDVTAPGKKRTNDDEGKTSNVKVKKQKTTRRKPRKHSKKQPQHVLADDTGHEADNQTSSGTFL